MVGPSYFQRFQVTFWIAGRWLVDGWENTCCIKRPTIQQKTIQYKQKQNQMAGWLVLHISRTFLFQIQIAGRWLGDGWEMAWWLPLVISKDWGCNSISLQDGWEMTGWLTPTNNDFGCICRSPRDGLEMAGGWLGEHLWY